MKTIYLTLIITIGFTEYYSVGLCFAAKKCGLRYYGLCLIPFYAFFAAIKVTGTFNLFTITVRKFGMMVMELIFVLFLALLFASWGDANLPEVSRVSLWQMMWLVAIICALIIYSAIIAFSRKLYRRFRIERENLFVLLSLPLITLPLLYIIASGGSPRHIDDMF